VVLLVRTGCHGGRGGGGVGDGPPRTDGDVGETWPGDSLDAVRANQKKHERLEQELAQEEGKLKALNTLGQSVRFSWAPCFLLSPVLTHGIRGGGYVAD
jgi:hypothetical protein